MNVTDSMPDEPGENEETSETAAPAPKGKLVAGVVLERRRTQRNPYRPPRRCLEQQRPAAIGAAVIGIYGVRHRLNT